MAAVTLTVGLLGDYNQNGSVDAADYVVWRKAADSLGGDSGYDTWRAQFGATASGGTVAMNAAVPESATVVQVVLAIAVLAAATRT